MVEFFAVYSIIIKSFLIEQFKLLCMRTVGPLLLYKSGTRNGSSGSPVLKEVNGELVPVALHRGGNPTTQLYKGCNFGTLFSAILSYLSGQPCSSCTCVCLSVCLCACVCFILNLLCTYMHSVH